MRPCWEGKTFLHPLQMYPLPVPLPAVTNLLVLIRHSWQVHETLPGRVAGVEWRRVQQERWRDLEHEEQERGPSPTDSLMRGEEQRIQGSCAAIRKSIIEYRPQER